MAEHLKKTFKDSLGDIKERMKEKRNQKWIRLGKINQVSNVKCKKATTRSMQMKSIQANNRALAVALQEEKLKLREAQDMILHLREEYQDLKVQMFNLQRKLRFEKAQGSFKTQLSTLSEIISKVSRNLLDSVDLLRPAKDLCFADNQSAFSSVLENNSGAIGQMYSVSSPLVNGHDCLLRRETEAGSDGNELPQSMSEICQESENGVPLMKIVLDKGQTYDFHLDNATSELENVSSSEKDKQFGNVLPKSVSTRRRYSKMRTHDELCTGALDHSETPDSTRTLSNNETRLVESLEECSVENINSAVSQLNKNTVDSELVLRQVHFADARFNSDNNSDFKQHEHKSREDSQVKREKRPKKKLEGTKNTSRPRSKKRQGKEASKEKSDFLGRSSDAYDFHFEESVHVTPFRQNRVKETETSMDDKKAFPESDNAELSDTEEDSDDSIYVPCKSKKRKSSAGQNDQSPIHARPRSKRCLAQREQKLQNEKEAKSSKSSDRSIREPLEPLEPSRGLCDVTNTASSFLTGNTLAVPQGEVSPAPKRKRSCTLTVNYKEPSIAGKLRRGDPFTDTYFLNSPIFKQKKDAKRHSLKESLSKYNEKFVGCR